MLKSFVCKQQHFYSSWFDLWTARFGFPAPSSRHLHRKVWEWAAISQALFERGALKPGARGIGFAVGQEPLASLFAQFGARIEATDLFLGEVADLWRSSNQYADSKEALFRSDIIERQDFEDRVSFYNADMNDLSNLEKGSYDFLWSSCAMEHLGTLEKGAQFVQSAMDLLKPGGIACHTTEFNVSSLTSTIEAGQSVLFRESDIRELDCALRMRLCCIENIEFDRGCDEHDILFDFPPYGAHGRKHIKLLSDGYIATSMVLICRKFE